MARLPNRMVLRELLQLFLIEHLALLFRLLLQGWKQPGDMAAGLALSGRTENALAVAV